MRKLINNNRTQNNTFAIPGVKRIVLLGHCGFIGRHLKKTFETLYTDTEIIGKSLPVLDLTVKGDVEELSGLFNVETAVIMCAAVKRQFGDSLQIFEKNLGMTNNVCRVLENNPVKRFIFFSSSAVYGEDVHNTCITEDTPVCPTSYYGLVKYTAERLYAKTLGNQSVGSLAILRPPLIYGPGDLGNTYGPSGFIKAALDNEPIVLWGDATELREFIFVEDIVPVVCGLLSSDFEGVVNVASGKSYTFQDVLKIISQLVGEELQVTYRPRTKDKVDNVFDNTQFMQLMPTFQFTSIDEGIRKTFAAEAEIRKQTIKESSRSRC